MNIPLATPPTDMGPLRQAIRRRCAAKPSPDGPPPQSGGVHWARHRAPKQLTQPPCPPHMAYAPRIGTHLSTGICQEAARKCQINHAVWPAGVDAPPSPHPPLAPHPPYPPHQPMTLVHIAPAKPPAHPQPLLQPVCVITRPYKNASNKTMPPPPQCAHWVCGWCQGPLTSSPTPHFWP